MGFYKIKGISEKMKHGRYRAAVPACILHSRAGWSWTEEVVDTVHEQESWNLDIIKARNQRNKGVSLDLFRAHQIRIARERFAKHGGQDVEYLLSQRIWRFCQEDNWCEEDWRH